MSGSYMGLGYIRTPTPYNVTDKEQTISDIVQYMYSRTQRMFEYDGLPSSLPARTAELYMQQGGYVGIAAYHGELYPLTGGLGGVQDAYYMPTKFVFANPGLSWSDELTIGEECIVIPNDSMYTGLMPLLRKYATLLCENEISLRLADINSRLISILSAPDTRSKEGVEAVLKMIVEGRIGVALDNAFLEGIKSLPYFGSGTTASITQLIEEHQYLLATLWNELGVRANYNMKREAINEAEGSMSDNILLPLIDDMLACREAGWKAVNKLYGTDIKVRLSSAWEITQKEAEIMSEPPEDETEDETDETEDKTDEPEAAADEPEDDPDKKGDDDK